jgi:formate dehydrogenase maturation protein FdhE
VALLSGIAKQSHLGFSNDMSTLQEIEAGVKQLSKAEQLALHEWLENLLEDEFEFTDAFKAELDQAKRDIEAGKGRVVKP